MTQDQRCAAARDKGGREPRVLEQAEAHQVAGNLAVQVGVVVVRAAEREAGVQLHRLQCIALHKE